jgi:exodeoxyribonuclease VII large subunit
MTFNADRIGRGRILTVSAAVKAIGDRLTSPPGGIVEVSGEVADWRPWRDFVLCTIADSGARISVVMPPAVVKSFGQAAVAGTVILVKGYWELFSSRGALQLRACAVALLDQEGMKRAEKDRNLATLAAEGLLGRRRLQLPADPEVIGVVTSRGSDAFADIVSVVEQRAHWTHIVLAAASVQGPRAETEVPCAIAALERAEPRPDVIIVARGGGSDHDLWVFNSLPIARSIAGSSIPIVTALGHAPDSTWADLVSDGAAPTPSAAATMVTSDGAAIRAHLRELKDHLIRCVDAATAHLAAEAVLRASTVMNTATEGIAEELAGLRALRSDTLPAAVRRSLGERHMDVQRFGADMRRTLDGVLAANQATTCGQRTTLRKIATEHGLARHASELAAMRAQVGALSPHGLLERGYAFLTRDGLRVKSVAELQRGDLLRLRHADGEIIVEVRTTHLNSESNHV